jgi:site-specific recombinase XerD
VEVHRDDERGEDPLRARSEIQKPLGHKDLTTTAVYTRVDVRSLAAMIRRCHPRERGLQ